MNASCISWSGQLSTTAHLSQADAETRTLCQEFLLQYLCTSKVPCCAMSHNKQHAPLLCPSDTQMRRLPASADFGSAPLKHADLGANHLGGVLFPMLTKKRWGIDQFDFSLWSMQKVLQEHYIWNTQSILKYSRNVRFQGLHTLTHTGVYLRSWVGSFVGHIQVFRRTWKKKWNASGMFFATSLSLLIVSSLPDGKITFAIRCDSEVIQKPLDCQFGTRSNEFQDESTSAYTSCSFFRCENFHKKVFGYGS